MLMIGVVALSYVVLRACSTSNNAPKNFATGGLSRLVTLESAPPMPSLLFKDANGDDISLKDISANGPMLVNIWATWCAPCVAELPSLNQLANDYPALTLVAISVDRNADDAQAFLDKIGAVNIALYHDNTFAIAGKDALAANGIPLTVIYNSSGDEISRIQGEADWQSEAAKDYIKSLGW